MNWRAVPAVNNLGTGLRWQAVGSCDWLGEPRKS